MSYFARGEAALLQKFRDGDRAVLESVYRAYVGSVARAVAGTLRRYVGDDRHKSWRRIAAELPDLVQEVFARAFEPQTRQRFDGIREYGPYLGQIARNVVVDHIRRNHKLLALVQVELFDEIRLSPPDDPSDDYGDLHTMALVSGYLARLPADLLRVHEALYIQGLSQREAAISLGLGRQVIRTLEAKLREGLRKELTGIGPSVARGGHRGARAGHDSRPGEGRVVVK